MAVVKLDHADTGAEMAAGDETASIVS